MLDTSMVPPGQVLDVPRDRFMARHPRRVVDVEQQSTRARAHAPAGRPGGARTWDAGPPEV